MAADFKRPNFYSHVAILPSYLYYVMLLVNKKLSCRREAVSLKILLSLKVIQNYIVE